MSSRNIEGSSARDLYHYLQNNEQRVTINAFMKMIYFLQDRYFTLFDAKEAFYSSKGEKEHSLTYNSFENAVQKLARLKYKYATDVVALKGILHAIKKQRVPIFDDIRTQLLKRETLDILQLYYTKLVQSFYLYGCDPTHGDVKETGFMTIEGFVDFLNAYIEYEEIISFEEIQEMAITMLKEFPISMDEATEKKTAKYTNVILFPHFIELVCRVASKFHIVKLKEEGARLRLVVETCRLEFSVELFLKHMDIKVISNDISIPNQKAPFLSQNTNRNYEGISNLNMQVTSHNNCAVIDDVYSAIEKILEADNSIMNPQLSLRRQSQLFRRLPPRQMKDSSVYSDNRLEIDNSSAKHDRSTNGEKGMAYLTVIQEVVTPPILPVSVLEVLRHVIMYQNLRQFHMALSSLHSSRQKYSEACTEQNVTEEPDAKLYFVLCAASIYDSARNEFEAMQKYLEALELCAILPIQHPGRAVAKSCLGAALFNSGKLDLAKLCHQQVLQTRRNSTELGEDNLLTAIAMNNLSCCLCRDPTSSGGEEALRLLTEAKRIYHAACGPRNTTYALLLSNIERVKKSQQFIILDKDGAERVGNYSRVIAGSRFQINALIPVKSKRGKKKKKSRKKKTKNKL